MKIREINIFPGKEKFQEMSTINGLYFVMQKWKHTGNILKKDAFLSQVNYYTGFCKVCHCFNVMVEKPFLELANRASWQSFRLYPLKSIHWPYQVPIALCWLHVFSALGDFCNNDVSPLMYTLKFFDLEVENKYICLFLKPFSHKKPVFTYWLFPWMVLFPIEAFLFTKYNRI